jgi:hypothetical protein
MSLDRHSSLTDRTQRSAKASGRAEGVADISHPLPPGSVGIQCRTWHRDPAKRSDSRAVREIDALVAYMTFAEEAPWGEPCTASRSSRRALRNGGRATGKAAVFAISTWNTVFSVIR